MASIIIKVTKDGVPLEGAEVRVSGIGVEDTDEDGCVDFSLTAALRGRGAVEILRGARYAARVGKASGKVTDEADYALVQVFKGAFAGSFGAWLVPDVETVIEV